MFTAEEESMLNLIEQHVKESPNQCGDCTLCCTALDVKEDNFNKPMGVKCEHLATCGGCAIYTKRPDVCRAFYCMWMMSPFMNIGLPPYLKPSECGFVLSWDVVNSPLLITLFKDPDRPNNWVKYKKQLETIARKNDLSIAIGGGHTATHVLSPIGNWYAKTDYPEFFKGLSVGVPREDYRRKL